jgi:putative oxygen-independent coproporphyrinogen III oxidase
MNLENNIRQDVVARSVATPAFAGASSAIFLNDCFTHSVLATTESGATFLPSLYIHFPWCLKKCPYCDFNSYPAAKIPEEKYLKKMIFDLKQSAEKLKRSELKSIFLGGGTPSLFSAKKIDQLLSEAEKTFSFAKKIEISIEANPGTINKKYCRELKAIGINRISLGVQSFQDEKLMRIGRIYRSKEVFAAIDAIQSAAFENYNFDLIYGLPEQSVFEALFDLKQAISLAPKHVSWYQLTIEPKTPFARTKIILPAEETIIKMEKEGRHFLKDKKYFRYEISAYAKKGFECWHNLNYWEYGDYLGIGAGAHSKISDPEKKEIWRIAKISDPKKYLRSKNLIVKREKILAKERPLDFFLNAFRLMKPISVDLFEKRTWLKIGPLEKQLKVAQDLGLLKYDGKKIVVTTHGHNFLNDLLGVW